MNQREGFSNEETISEYIEARRQVKRIVKHVKCNKELSIARIYKHNPKGFASYINERSIIVSKRLKVIFQEHKVC